MTGGSLQPTDHIGTLLLLGLASRFAACPLIVTMPVALATAHHDDLHGIFDLVGLVEWTYIAVFGVIVVLGPGVVSLDTLVVRALGKKTAQ